MDICWILPVFLMITVLVSGCVSQNETQPPGQNGVEPTGEVKTFEMTARQFSFDPNVITVNKGDTVKLRITSIDVPHGFSLPDFAISEILEPGKAVNVEFVADRTGTFSFQCSVPCGSGHGGMNGQLVIE